MAAGRREFIAGLQFAATAGMGLATPALANSSPDVQWRMTSSFPPSLNLIYGGGRDAGPRRSPISPTAISPSPFRRRAKLRRRSKRSTPSPTAGPNARTPRSPIPGARTRASSSASSTPFGMNARQHAAWLQEGGGGDLVDELLAQRQGARLSRREHRRADGGLVPQGNPRTRRLHRPENAHRRLRRQSVPDARRQPVAMPKDGI